MKRLIFAFILVGNCSVSFCQESKPRLDTSAFRKWPSAGIPSISNNGAFAAYTIDNQPVGNLTLVIQGNETDWKIEIPGLDRTSFTDDSRYAVFLKPGDSLCIVKLGTSSIEYISNIISFRLFKQGSIEWLAYQFNNPQKELVLRNLITNEVKLLSNVKEYFVSKSGNKLLVHFGADQREAVVQIVDLLSGNTIQIWKGSNANGFVFDDSETQLAFVVDEGMAAGAEAGKSIWYYKQGTEKPLKMADDRASGIDTGLRIGSISKGFSKNGKMLFFTLSERELLKPGENAVMVDVWSYTDTKLQSQQLKDLGVKGYLSTLRLDSRQIIRLQHENEYVSATAENDEFVITTTAKGNGGEWNWNRTSLPQDYVVSAVCGKRKPIEVKGTKLLMEKYLSKKGNYFIYKTPEQGDYFGYNLLSGSNRNLTQSFQIPAINKDYDEPGRKDRGLYFAAFLEDDKGALIYDKFDIWQIDLAGNSLPVNLTNGYGRKHNIVFRLAEDYNGRAVSVDEKLLLSAFSKSNKNSGFFSTILTTKGDPKLLTMGPYFYSLLPTRNRPRNDDKEVYVVSRESSTQSPNYYWTTNFEEFRPITNVHPEKNYSLLTSQLLVWKTFDGQIMQGVLYKPENFDREKRYPIIFYYYERMSDELNHFHTPEPLHGWMNIPWLVSNGYLVFTPDIHYRIGQPGQSAYNSVVSAAKYLSKFPWVDSSKMGITGHSFGGYETNYLLTHSNLFAAAISSAGMANLTSDYGSLSHGDQSKQPFYELGQCRIGASLWQRPDLFLKNSPIFRADKVETPLLIMHNKGDDAVPYAQGVEFFTALRRLGKRVWMLQYDGEGHSIWGEKECRDFTIRSTQFFDHYLKGAPAPKWMTRGIPAKYKGVDTGLELDSEVKTPGSGLFYK